MPQTAIHADEGRRTETPNAIMTTLASPSQGCTKQLSMWTVAMRDGQKGPSHIFDCEQIWHVLVGIVEINLASKTVELTAGDTIVIPADIERQVSARSDVRLVVCGRSDGIAAVPGDAGSRGVPPWIR